MIAFTILSSVSLNVDALQCYVCASCVAPDIGTLTTCASNSSTVACSVDYILLSRIILSKLTISLLIENNNKFGHFKHNIKKLF
jgi:hypothetical protein